jgi:hypothetical protein
MIEGLLVLAQTSSRSQGRLWGLAVVLAVVGLLYVSGRAKKGNLTEFRPFGQPIIMTLPITGSPAVEAIVRAVSTQGQFRLDDKTETHLLISNALLWFRVSHIEDDDEASKWRVERQAKFGWMDNLMNRQGQMALENFERKVRMTVKGSMPSGTSKPATSNPVLAQDDQPEPRGKEPDDVSSADAEASVLSPDADDEGESVARVDVSGGTVRGPTTCASCGASNPPEHAFCTNCGGSLVSTAP